MINGLPKQFMQVHHYQNNRRYMKKNGFTLSELMIALTVLGLLCAALLPAILRTTPNQNKIMMKRAYYTTANVVSDMINNPNLYPVMNSSGSTTTGFDNMDAVTYAGETYGGDYTSHGDGAFAKFIGLFAAHLNIDGEINKECSTTSSDPDTPPPIVPGGSSEWKYCRIFTTPDGILWDLRTIHKVTTSETTTTITVDVNGDKKPNCLQGDSDADEACKDRTSNFDRFSMVISDDGTITIPEDQTWAREAIQVGSSIND